MFRFKSITERRAVVAEPIRPNETGRVRFQGSWWSARCEQEIILMPGEVVYVTGNRGIVLLVVPDVVFEAEVVAKR